MTKEKIYSPKSHAKNPHLNSMEEFQSMYEQSIDDPNLFFSERAKDRVNFDSS